jgi:hypothetical protein
MFLIKDVEILKNIYLIFNNFFDRKSCLGHNVEKCGIGRHATDDNIIWHMRVACWIIRATNTHSERVILIDFPSQNFYAQAYDYYTYTNNLVHLTKQL